MDTVLKISSLRKEYGKIVAVNNLDLSIPKGSVFGLLGPNGSGKTTTLGMVLGVTHPTSGTYSWFDEPDTNQVKKRIGALLETPNFYPYLSGYENLKLVASIKEVANPRMEPILDLVNLRSRAKSKFKTYSLGMKQRLAIAAALIGDPEVLVLDEPTNGLDPQGIAEMRDMIREIANRGITVILASHLLVEIEKVCTHVAVLRRGNLLFSGSTDELTGQEGVVEIKATDNAALLSAIEGLTGVDSFKQSDEGFVTLVINKQTDAAGINRQLSQKGIYIDHLVFRKNSLEQQFLDLIKK